MAMVQRKTARRTRRKYSRFRALTRRQLLVCRAYLTDSSWGAYRRIAEDPLLWGDKAPVSKAVVYQNVQRDLKKLLAVIDWEYDNFKFTITEYSQELVNAIDDLLLQQQHRAGGMAAAAKTRKKKAKGQL